MSDTIPHTSDYRFCEKFDHLNRKKLFCPIQNTLFRSTGRDEKEIQDIKYKLVNLTVGETSPWVTIIC